MFRGSLQAVDSDEMSGRVVVFASVVGFTELTAGQPAAFNARIAKPTRRDLTVAVLSSTDEATLGEAAPIQRAAQRVRTAFATAARSALPADQAAMLPALVLGDTSALTGETTAEFRASGLTHLTAVSGANVTIVCGAVLLAAGLVGPRVAVALAARCAGGVRHRRPTVGERVAGGGDGCHHAAGRRVAPSQAGDSGAVGVGHRADDRCARTRRRHRVRVVGVGDRRAGRRRPGMVATPGRSWLAQAARRRGERRRRRSARDGAIGGGHLGHIQRGGGGREPGGGRRDRPDHRDRHRCRSVVHAVAGWWRAVDPVHRTRAVVAVAVARWAAGVPGASVPVPAGPFGALTVAAAGVAAVVLSQRRWTRPGVCAAVVCLMGWTLTTVGAA